MVIVYSEISEITEELYKKAYALIPEYRKQKADRLKNESDKKRSVAAAILLNTAVRMYESSRYKECKVSEDAFESNISVVDIKEAVCEYDSSYDYEVDYYNNGKPVFTGKGAKVRFNVSHAGDYVACVVSSSECGIDIEGDRKVNDKVADRFFTQKECKWIYKTSDNISFFKIWTLKEAYSKATGSGIAYGIGEISFIADENDRLTIEDEIKRREYGIIQYQIEDRYVLSVVYKKTGQSE